MDSGIVSIRKFLGAIANRPSPRHCILGAAVGIGLTLLFPPFVVATNQYTVSLGWGFLFDGPQYRDSLNGTVNVPLLMAEWVAILLVAGLAWIYLRNRSS